MSGLQAFTQIFGLLFLLIFGGLVGGFFLWFQIGRRRRPNLRKIPAFSDLPMQVGNAVEGGERLHVSLGREGITSSAPASVLAGLTVLDMLTESAIISDKPPTVSAGDATAILLAQDTLRRVYRQQNTMERYDHDAATLVGLSAWSYGAGAGLAFNEDQVATAVLIGHFNEEVALIAEGGARRGAYMVVASGDARAQALSYVLASQPLIGEDVYAAGAYLRNGRAAHIGSLMAQDVVRLVLVAIILLGGFAGLILNLLP